MAKEIGHSAIELEAAHWVACRMGDEQFDRERFDAWVAADPLRARIFEKMWQSVMGPEMKQALSTFERQAKSKGLIATGGVIAALVLAVSIVSAPAIELMLAQPQTYTATIGSTSEIKLQDGSQLILAGGSEVRVTYTGHLREIELIHGTIFADVVHDPDRVFKVKTKKAVITDLGTRFEVSQKPSDVRVSVESGEVRFSENRLFGSDITLAASQSGVLGSDGLRRGADVSADKIAPWRQSWIEYKDVPLSQVIDDLQSGAPFVIQILEDRISNMRVTGRIKLTDPESQLEKLALLFGFQIRKNEGAVKLTSE